VRIRSRSFRPQPQTGNPGGHVHRAASSRSVRFTQRSSSEWNEISTRRPPGRSRRSAASIVTRGRWPGKRIAVEEDASEPKAVVAAGEFAADGKTTLSKVDAVFLSGNATRDDIPSHLIVAGKVPPSVQEFYEHMCPAGVYESGEDGLVVNAPNCIDCKATDVLGPRWTAREGGSGPAYKRM